MAQKVANACGCCNNKECHGLSKEHGSSKIPYYDRDLLLPFTVGQSGWTSMTLLPAAYAGFTIPLFDCGISFADAMPVVKPGLTFCLHSKYSTLEMAPWIRMT